jgi:hypothetical protein
MVDNVKIRNAVATSAARIPDAAAERSDVLAGTAQLPPPSAPFRRFTIAPRAS